MRNLLVAQSGGPTSAINATIAGVIMEAHASDQVDTIYGKTEKSGRRRQPVSGSHPDFPQT